MTLVRADAVRLPLRDESVDLIVTSPPYFALRSYTDGGEHYAGQIGSEPTPRDFLEALWAVTAECRRVLKPSGSMFVNLGDKYAGSGGHNNAGVGASHDRAPTSYNKAADVRPKSLMGLPWLYALGATGALAALGGPDPGLDLILRAEIVWAKPNGLPESVTDRVRRSHEQWFHFTKEPTYFAAVDEVREQTAPPSTTALRGPTVGYKTNNDRADAGMGNFMPNPLGKLPGSVWTVPTEPLRVPDHLGVDHFAAFPTEWPRRLILGWSPSGVCVECGEGRRPVVDLKRTDNGSRPTYVNGAHAAAGGHGHKSGHAETTVTITGYACACPDPSAPTRPAVVLDPFGGTGTTAMVARALGRYGASVDLSADYLRLARWRIYESGHGRRALDRTWAERQGGLFDEVVA